MSKLKEKKIEKYNHSIDALPSIRGTGSYNASICSVVMHGIHLGFTVDEIKHDLKFRGRGCYQQNEIENAYRSCLRTGAAPWDFENNNTASYVRPETLCPLSKPNIEHKVKIIDKKAEMMELIEASPYRLVDEPNNDLSLILEYGFNDDEHIFIGDKFDTNVYKVKDAKRSTDFLRTKPFTCINPFSGKQSETNNGKLSYRSERSISHVRYMLIEMDETTIEKQVGFWLEQIKKLPVFAIIDSGKKSLHGWLKVDCEPDEWDNQRNKLFDLFKPYGIDKACKNKSRLSRTASHDREGGRKQCLLFLNTKYGV